MKLKAILRLAIAIIPLTGGAHAANLLVNGSFETGDFTGWNFSGSAIMINGNSSDGNYTLAFNFGNLIPYSLLSQSFTTIPQVNYILSFDMGAHGDNNYFPSQALRIVLQGTGLLYQGDIVDLTSSSTGSVDYDPYSFPFIADSTLTTLSFQDISGASEYMDAYLDNVQILPSSNPVPEPSTFLPAALLVMGAFLRRRRGRARRSGGAAA